MSDDTTWYWDLRRNRPVPASERGRAEDMLGPYETRAEAEAWRTRVEERNEAWDEADEEWQHRGQEHHGGTGEQVHDRR